MASSGRRSPRIDQLRKEFMQSRYVYEIFRVPPPVIYQSGKCEQAMSSNATYDVRVTHNGAEIDNRVSRTMPRYNDESRLESDIRHRAGVEQQSESHSTMIDNRNNELNRAQTIGRLPIQRQRDLRSEREQQGLQRMSDRSQNPWPPVDEVKFWPEKHVEYIRYPNGSREMILNGKTAYMENVDHQWQGPNATTIEHLTVKRAPHLTKRHEEIISNTTRRDRPVRVVGGGAAPANNDWADRECNEQLQRRAASTLSRSGRDTSMEANSVLNSQLAPSKNQDNTMLTYTSPPWQLNLKKEIFYPGETISDERTLTVIYNQVIDDVTKPDAHFRIRDYERNQILDIFHGYDIALDAAKTPMVPMIVKRMVVDTARHWPLYFCRYYPVVEDRRSEYVAEMLAIGETGVRLIARDYASDDQHPLSVIDHFEFNDLSRVEQLEPRLLRLVTRRGAQIRLYSDYCEQMRNLIMEYITGPDQSRYYARALADYVTTDKELLSFKVGDRIEVIPLDAVAHDGVKPDDGRQWLFGRCDERIGYFPAEYIDANVGEHRQRAFSPTRQPQKAQQQFKQQQYMQQQQGQRQEFVAMSPQQQLAPSRQ